MDSATAEADDVKGETQALTLQPAISEILGSRILLQKERMVWLLE